MRGDVLEGNVWREMSFRTIANVNHPKHQECDAGFSDLSSVQTQNGDNSDSEEATVEISPDELTSLMNMLKNRWW